MTNKKIASEIAVGIILMLVIVIGGIFWLQNKKEITVPSPKPLIQESKPIAKSEIKIPDTFPIATTEETKDWKTYTNKKYGYTLKYPSDMNCTEDFGVGTIPEDEYFCSSSGKDRLYIAIKPQIVIPNQKQITFTPMIGVGSLYKTIDVKNNDIVGSIYEKMKSLGVDKSTAEPYLNNTIPINTDSFKPFAGVEKMIGFSNTYISKSEGVNRDGVLIARTEHDYDKSWFFIKNNILFQMYTRFDDVLLTPAEATDENFQKRLGDIPNLEKIFSTIEFSKANGKYVDLNPIK